MDYVNKTPAAEAMLASEFVHIAPKARALTPEEFEEVSYWVRIQAQSDAAQDGHVDVRHPLLEASIDLYGEAAIGVAISRVTNEGIALPDGQHMKLYYLYVAELGLAKLRRIA